MNDEILRIVNEYSFNYKIADLSFMQRILGILISNYGVQNYVDSSISYDKKSSNYNFKLGKISFRTDEINFIYKVISRNYNKLDTFLITNLYAVAKVFHEFNHVLQFKSIDTIPNSLEGILSNYCFNIIDEKNRYYKKYYHFFPIERMADINAYRKICQLLESESNPQLKCHFDIIRSYYEVFGYNIDKKQGLVSPLEIFFKSVKNRKQLDSIKENFNYLRDFTLDDIEYYGLPSPSEEIIIKKIKKISSKDFVTVK